MARTNLLKIDDLLLRAGSIAGLVWGLGMAIALAVRLQSQQSGVAGLLAIGLLTATAPIGLTIAGLRARRRENRAWALHRLIDDHVEIAADDLLRGSDFDEESLDRAIRDLNNAGVAFLVWDRTTGVIQDGRLRRAQVVIDECHACGAKVSVSVRLGDACNARCPYCHDPLGGDRLMEKKAKLIDELDGARTSMGVQRSSNFSVGIFIVLSVLFWPLGVGYALWHWRMSRV